MFTRRRIEVLHREGQTIERAGQADDIVRTGTGQFVDFGLHTRDPIRLIQAGAALACEGSDKAHADIPGGQVADSLCLSRIPDEEYVPRCVIQYSTPVSVIRSGRQR